MFLSSNIESMIIFIMKHIIENLTLKFNIDILLQNSIRNLTVGIFIVQYIFVFKYK